MVHAPLNADRCYDSIDRRCSRAKTQHLFCIRQVLKPACQCGCICRKRPGVLELDARDATLWDEKLTSSIYGRRISSILLQRRNRCLRTVELAVLPMLCGKHKDLFITSVSTSPFFLRRVADMPCNSTARKLEFVVRTSHQTALLSITTNSQLVPDTSLNLPGPSRRLWLHTRSLILDRPSNLALHMLNRASRLTRVWAGTRQPPDIPSRGVSLSLPSPRSMFRC